MHLFLRVAESVENGRRTVRFRGKDGGQRNSHPRQRYFRDSERDVTEMTL